MSLLAMTLPDTYLVLLSDIIARFVAISLGVFARDHVVYLCWTLGLTTCSSPTPELRKVGYQPVFMANSLGNRIWKWAEQHIPFPHFDISAERVADTDMVI